MERVYLTLFIATIHLASFGQRKGDDKNIEVSAGLVGSWKFDYALYGASFLGMKSADTSKIFHTDTIHFFKDMTFRFRSHNTEYTNVTVHTGIWEITNKGETLIYKERVTRPPFDGKLPGMTFPIRIVDKDRIRIDYIFIYGETGNKPPANNTPVFFDRIK